MIDRTAAVIDGSMTPANCFRLACRFEVPAYWRYAMNPVPTPRPAFMRSGRWRRCRHVDRRQCADRSGNRLATRHRGSGRPVARKAAHRSRVAVRRKVVARSATVYQRRSSAGGGGYHRHGRTDAALKPLTPRCTCSRARHRRNDHLSMRLWPHLKILPLVSRPPFCDHHRGVTGSGRPSWPIPVQRCFVTSTRCASWVGAFAASLPPLRQPQHAWPR